MVEVEQLSRVRGGLRDTERETITGAERQGLGNELSENEREIRNHGDDGGQRDLLRGRRGHACCSEQPCQGHGERCAAERCGRRADHCDADLNGRKKAFRRCPEPQNALRNPLALAGEVRKPGLAHPEDPPRVGVAP